MEKAYDKHGNRKIGKLDKGDVVVINGTTYYLMSPVYEGETTVDEFGNAVSKYINTKADM